MSSIKKTNKANNLSVAKKTQKIKDETKAKINITSVNKPEMRQLLDNFGIDQAFISGMMAYEMSGIKELQGIFLSTIGKQYDDRKVMVLDKDFVMSENQRLGRDMSFIQDAHTLENYSSVKKILEFNGKEDEMQGVSFYLKCSWSGCDEHIPITYDAISLNKNFAFLLIHSCCLCKHHVHECEKRMGLPDRIVSSAAYLTACQKCGRLHFCSIRFGNTSKFEAELCHFCRGNNQFFGLSCDKVFNDTYNPHTDFIGFIPKNPIDNHTYEYNINGLTVYIKPDFNPRNY